MNKYKFCQNCGNKCNQSDMFCEVCGYHFDELDNETLKGSLSKSQPQTNSNQENVKPASKANTHVSKKSHKGLIISGIIVIMLLIIGFIIVDNIPAPNNTPANNITKQELNNEYNTIGHHIFNDKIKAADTIHGKSITVNPTVVNQSGSNAQLSAMWKKLYIQDKSAKKIPLKISRHADGKTVATGYTTSSKLKFK